ncbi:MAG: enoyl-CoA hydratase/isomerase family protein [Salinirussus sp.]
MDATGTNGVVELTFEGGVAELRFVDPDRRNCFSLDLAADLFELVRRLVDHDDLRTVAITGVDPVFCAGVDTGLIGGADPAAMDQVHEYRRPVFRWLRDGPVPVVVGAQGAAAGTGAYFLAAADIVVAGRNLSVWYPEVEYGIPTVEEAVHLAERVGRAKALEMTLGGQAGALDADAAKRWGLVTSVVDADTVREATLECARSIANGLQDEAIPQALRSTMTRVRREQTAATLEWATEAQERGRFGWMVATSGRSLYE